MYVNIEHIHSKNVFEHETGHWSGLNDNEKDKNAIMYEYDSSQPRNPNRFEFLNFYKGKSGTKGVDPTELDLRESK